MRVRVRNDIERDQKDFQLPFLRKNNNCKWSLIFRRMHDMSMTGLLKMFDWYIKIVFSPAPRIYYKYSVMDNSAWKI